ncbi:MAG: GTP 3',8-cyclase MoaA [Actinomycetota bacterium]
MDDSADTPVPRPLVDGFGRVHRDLRISVTDRCNFRCTYCMPEEGMTWLPRSEVLTFEELERLATLLVERHGIRSIRLTGGEPTVRAHLPVLVSKLAALPVDLALTTNGATLRSCAADLAAAGLRRVNVSLDSLQQDRFLELTRRDELANVLDGIDAAVEAGLAPVKVNVVVVRDVNDDEVVELAHYGRERGVTVRFIEFMPLDGGDEWRNDQVVSQAEIVAKIGAVFPLEAIVRGHEPAERFRYLDGRGEVGVIPSVTRPFCEQCDRIRLTADGQLRSCLFSLADHDLRDILRGGGSDDDLSSAIEACVGAKWAGHAINQVQFVRPRRSMSQIGG